MDPGDTALSARRRGQPADAGADRGGGAQAPRLVPVVPTRAGPSAVPYYDTECLLGWGCPSPCART